MIIYLKNEKDMTIVELEVSYKVDINLNLINYSVELLNEMRPQSQKLLFITTINDIMEMKNWKQSDSYDLEERVAERLHLIAKNLNLKVAGK